ncbi:tRNA1(Val) (adenine(37)-N6)-methyltransferase [Endozoicomonas ascidiicola]|uniref:tRNA1(Val) (adenine(37)-N6)-methyltransferase n=1 Tax=Endozoicomonas ascidiicola TaxID=1698521 RepID=UPI00082F2349|nr:methyltransferase [Endozoicomonas ascidiicola]
MARNRYFQFKQFRIEQGECAMKVTTDACLFGALFAQSVHTQQSHSILDIGAGTGLLSLMTAQNTQSAITSVELDDAAAQQAAFNFSASPWSHQLSVVNQSIQDFSQQNHNIFDSTFDSIITNPPFFQQSSKGSDQRRNLARHTDSLSFDDLAQSIVRHLAQTGEAWVLLPVDSSQHFLVACQHVKLCLFKRIQLRSSLTHPVHRHVLVLKRSESTSDENFTTIDDMVTIYDNHPTYTSEVQQLMSPYYLAL